MVDKFQKRPVVIEAMQWDGTMEAQVEIVKWGWGHISGWTSDKSPSGYCLRISTLEGEMEVHPGDWVIKGIKGEFYPCKPDIFGATYDRVSQ